MGTDRRPGALDEPAHADLTGSASIEAIAAAEGWRPDAYTIALATRIRDPGQPMGGQLERMRALVGTGPSASSASAQELGRHFAVTNALFERFALLAAQVQDPTSRRGAEAVERLTRTALGCQRAAQAVLGALHTIRQADAPTTPERPSEGLETPLPGIPGADGCEVG